MTKFKIILFLCNWGPHTAFQTLQEEAAQIPAEVKMVRIPCSGRISKALIFKPFEMGADGVALLSCSPGTCHYGTGTETTRKNVEDSRSILELIGLGKNRLRLGSFMPQDSEPLLKFLNDFVGEIKTLGKSPVSPPVKEAPLIERHKATKEIIARHDIYACQDCGKCSSACPLTLSGKPFSPRSMANAIISGDIDNPSIQKDFWACLTCGLCSDRCPSAINFPYFVRDVRHLMQKSAIKVDDVHGGFFPLLMRTMTSKDLRVKHWHWLPDTIQTDSQSKILFFGGCSPYMDIFFKKHLKTKLTRIMVDSLRLLNFFDIHPRLLDDERCCGHDMLWSGDRENYLKLAKLNVEAINDSGIEEMITACPECYHTFLHDYPRHGIETRFKVTHIFDFIEKEVDKGAVGFKKFPHKITFQDPCRLSRLQNRPNLPRKLIQRLDPIAFTEMQENGTGAICCGNCAWTGCDSFSKALQVKRIRSAQATGSDIMVTACPKCQIHLDCSMQDPLFGDDLNMEMMDLISILAKTIYWE